MNEYQYKILSINEKERWIYLQADIWDDEEPDSFVYLLKKIRDGLNGKIIDKGMTTYQIDNDPCHLTYQWDTLFGITIVYPEEISSKEAIEFLSKYF
jgi:hypothetical protein